MDMFSEKVQKFLTNGGIFEIDEPKFMGPGKRITLYFKGGTWKYSYFFSAAELAEVSPFMYNNEKDCLSFFIELVMRKAEEEWGK